MLFQVTITWEENYQRGRSKAIAERYPEERRGKMNNTGNDESVRRKTANVARKAIFAPKLGATRARAKMK
jgi:hypothetical protein